MVSAGVRAQSLHTSRVSGDFVSQDSVSSPSSSASMPPDLWPGLWRTICSSGSRLALCPLIIFFLSLPPMLPLPRGGRTAGLKRRVRGRGEEGKHASQIGPAAVASRRPRGRDRAAWSRLNCEPCSCPSNSDPLAGGVRATHQPELMGLAVDTEPQRPSTKFRFHAEQLTRLSVATDCFDVLFLF